MRTHELPFSLSHDSIGWIERRTKGQQTKKQRKERKGRMEKGDAEKAKNQISCSIS